MSATLPQPERKSGVDSIKRERDKQLVWSIFGVCAMACVLALSTLPDKILGFALAFGGAVVAYESIVVARRISRRDAQTDAPAVPGAKRHTVWT
jgi:hypothetical protein